MIIHPLWQGVHISRMQQFEKIYIQSSLSSAIRLNESCCYDFLFSDFLRKKVLKYKGNKFPSTLIPLYFRTFFLRKWIETSWSSPSSCVTLVSCAKHINMYSPYSKLQTGILLKIEKDAHACLHNLKQTSSTTRCKYFRILSSFASGHVSTKRSFSTSFIKLSQQNTICQNQRSLMQNGCTANQSARYMIKCHKGYYAVCKMMPLSNNKYMKLCRL